MDQEMAQPMEDAALTPNGTQDAAQETAQHTPPNGTVADVEMKEEVNGEVRRVASDRSDVFS